MTSIWAKIVANAIIARINLYWSGVDVHYKVEANPLHQVTSLSHMALLVQVGLHLV